MCRKASNILVELKQFTCEAIEHHGCFHLSQSFTPFSGPLCPGWLCVVHTMCLLHLQDSTLSSEALPGPLFHCCRVFFSTCHSSPANVFWSAKF